MHLSEQASPARSHATWLNPALLRVGEVKATAATRRYALQRNKGFQLPLILKEPPMIKRAFAAAIIALCCGASSANAGLLDGLWGGGCGGGCGCGCEATCGCQPTCACQPSCCCAPKCEPACGCHAEPACGCHAEPACGCPAPCCESCCHSCCCRPNIGAWLKKLFSRPCCHSCCQPTCCQPSCACEAKCSCEPSCECGH